MDLIEQADRFTVWTSNFEIQALIKQAVGEAPGSGVLQALCAKIGERTGMAEAAVMDLALLISRNPRLKPTDAGSVLAKRFLGEVFADGEALVGTVRGEMYGYDGRMWRALPPMELERLMVELVLTGSDPISRSSPHPVARAAMRLLKVLQTRAAPWERADGPGCVINTLSGELWIDQAGAVQMRPHRPSSGLRALVPVEALCPRFDQAMAEIFGAGLDFSADLAALRKTLVVLVS